MLPTVIVLEPLSECMVIGACAAWAVQFLFGWEPLVFYLVHILAWFLCDWMLLSIVQVSIIVVWHHSLNSCELKLFPYILEYFFGFSVSTWQIKLLEVCVILTTTLTSIFISTSFLDNIVEQFSGNKFIKPYQTEKRRRKPLPIFDLFPKNPNVYFFAERNVTF